MSISSNKKPNFIIEDYEENLLQPYINSEFIPNNIIRQAFILIIPSIEIVHEYSERHFISKIKVRDLLNTPITNWKYNRPPDKVRCEDIAKYIYLSKMPLDTMLYLNFNNKTRTFDIIDGIHRYTSLKIIQENNSSLDFITPGDYGSNNDAKWLYDSYVILNVRFNSTEGETIELFKTLNKSNPIPDLYIRDLSREKRDTIEIVANNWQIKYKSHFSSNNKPNKPNINRDRFIDLLEKIYTKYNINDNNKITLEKILDRANSYISNNIPRKISHQIIDKCKATGCWLFIYTDEQLLKIV
jgi:hypothetical protein